MEKQGKRKLNSKTLSIVLALCMVVVLLPLSAFAEDTVPPAETPPTPKLITAFTEPEIIKLDIGDTRTEADLMATFPKSLVATVEGEEDTLEVPVSGWTLDFSSHSSGAFAINENAEIYYEPSLTIPEGYTLSNEIVQPALKVQVGEELLHAPILMSTGVQVGDLIVTGGTQGTDYEYDSASNVLTITGNTSLEISMVTAGTTTTTDRIVVQNDGTDANAANITLNGVNIDVAAFNFCAFEIEGSAKANIILLGTNTLTSGNGKAGLQVQSTATLVLNGSGYLTATGSGGGAGIGGDNSGAGGTVKITGGVVTAVGNDGAGIGGGIGGAGGTVAISGGVVTATGGAASTGIGYGAGGTGGTLEISGGMVTATGGSVQALSSKPTYTLSTPSTDQFYSVDIRAGTNQTDAASKTLSEDYVAGSNYVTIAMNKTTPTIALTPIKTLTYNGKEQTQNVSVMMGGTSLTEGTQYTVSGNTATNAGDHTITIAFSSLGTNGVYDSTAGINYLVGDGTATSTFTIERALLTITGATAQSRAYDGTTTATADVSFGGLLNGETLTKDTDYTVSATFSSPDAGDNLTVGGVVQLTNTVLASNYIFNTAEFSFPTTASITPLAQADAQVPLGTPLSPQTGVY